jgi:hypothetical protein
LRGIRPRLYDPALIELDMALPPKQTDPNARDPLRSYVIVATGGLSLGLLLFILLFLVGFLLVH